MLKISRKAFLLKTGSDKMNLQQEPKWAPDLQRLSATGAPQQNFPHSKIEFRWTSIKCFRDDFNCRQENRSIVMKTFD